MAVGVLKWIKSSVAEKEYKIAILDKKVDCLEIINFHYNHEETYQRWDIKLNMSLFENALYIIAKHNPENFREVYFELKDNDPEFFETTQKVLKRIQREYSFD